MLLQQLHNCAGAWKSSAEGKVDFETQMEKWQRLETTRTCLYVLFDRGSKVRLRK